MTADADLRKRLAEHIERRIAELGLEYAEVARVAGFSIEVLRKMRQGEKARMSTYRKLERALQWALGSVQVILEGGEPTPLGDAARHTEPVPQVPPPSSDSGGVRALDAVWETLTPQQQEAWLRGIWDTLSAREQEAWMRYLRERQERQHAREQDPPERRRDVG